MKPSLRRRVALLGVTHNTNNFGVRVLLTGAVGCVSQANPHAEIVILDYGQSPSQWIEDAGAIQCPVRLINLRFSWKLGLPNNLFRLLVVVAIARLTLSRERQKRLFGSIPILREIDSIDIHYSLAGGDSFSDIYRLERFLYVALPQILVLWLDRPLVLLPQTYGPFKGRIARSIARYIFRRATAIYSRDAAGLDIVREIGGPDLIVRVVPDLGFAMSAEPVEREIDEQIERWRQRGPVVGVNISKLLYMGGYTGGNMFGLREDFPTLIREVVRYLADEAKALVLLIPHVYGGLESQESELVLCRELFPDFERAHQGRVGFFDRGLNHRQAKYVIGKCDAFTGARMHACIAAVSQCVPTVAQAYSDKFAGVMNVIDAQVQVVDLRREGAAELCAALRDTLGSLESKRRYLAARMPPVQDAIRRAFEPGSVETIPAPHRS